MKTLSLLFLIIGSVLPSLAAEPTQPELPKTGVNLERDHGGWLNVVVQDDQFVISFYNAKKEPVTADLHHGLVRYAYSENGSDRTVLRRSADGKTLISPHEVTPPDIFRVHLALFHEGADDLAETHAFSYKQK